MKPSALVFVIAAIAITATPLLAAQPSCKALSKALSSPAQKIKCYCGPELSNIELTLPKGLRLRAACGLRDFADTPIDLHSQKISLDRFGESDGRPTYPEGFIYLSGSILSSGVIGFEPSQSGDLSFHSSAKNLTATGYFSKGYLSDWKLTPDRDYQQLKISKSKSEKLACWTTKATIRAHDFEIRLFGTDDAGTYPGRIEVLKISPIRKCSE